MLFDKKDKGIIVLFIDMKYATIAVFILIAGGAILLLSHSSSMGKTPKMAGVINVTKATPQTSKEVMSTTSAAMQDVIIKYTDNGFSPDTVTIKQGQTVEFTNSSSSPMWVASGAHPVHADYDGTTLSEHCQNGNPTSLNVFDECHGIVNGQSWSFTFNKKGSWSFHNHLSASDTGTVSVE